ncbi:hypothetical protein G5I55_004511 [Escherichia coli]|nr:hypothetical protein [Escherichia coli]
MSGNSQHLSELFIIFIIAFLSIVVSFLCIDVFFSLVEWLITGNLNISLKEIRHVLFIGCVIGSFIGIECALAKYFRLKGF